MNHVQLTTEPSSAVYHCISLKICDHQTYISGINYMSSISKTHNKPEFGRHRLSEIRD